MAASLINLTGRRNARRKLKPTHPAPRFLGSPIGLPCKTAPGYPIETTSYAQSLTASCTSLTICFAVIRGPDGSLIGCRWPLAKTLTFVPPMSITSTRGAFKSATAAPGSSVRSGDGPITRPAVDDKPLGRAACVGAERPGGAVKSLVGGCVGDRVLIPNLSSQIERDRVDLIEARWIVRDATGPLRELIELVTAGLRLRRFGVTEDTHTVHDGLRKLGLLLDLLHRHGAGVVVSIGDQQQDLAVTCGVLPQVGLSHVHRIAQGRSPDGIDSPASRLAHKPVPR